MVFLAIERIFLIFQNENEGIFVAYIANICATIAILGYNLFSVYACFLHQVRKMGNFIIILNYEVEFTNISIFLLFTGVVCVETIIIYVYYSHTIRSKSLPHSQRDIGLAVAGAIQTIAYIPEIIELNELINSSH